MTVHIAALQLNAKLWNKTQAGMMGIQESEDGDHGDEGEEEVLGEENTLQQIGLFVLSLR